MPGSRVSLSVNTKEHTSESSLPELHAAWTEAARVGATAGRAGAAEAEEAAEEAAEAAAEEEELLLGCI